MKSINRRKALSFIYRAVIGITGVSVLGINANAQKPTKRGKIQKPGARAPQKLNRRQAIMQKTLDEELKDIKVLLENTRRVFVNEYGRLTPVVTKPTTELFPGATIPADIGNDLSSCMTNFNFGLDQGIWTCTDVNVCNGQGLDGWPGPGDDQDAGCETKNSCNGQTCDHLYTCRNNKCRNQSCPEFTDCDKNKQKIEPSCVADLLDKYNTDPYVEQLFHEFDVSTSQQLVKMLEVRVDAIIREVR